MKRTIVILVFVLMLGGLFVTPAGNHGILEYTDQEVAEFGETRINETLIQPDFEPAAEGSPSNASILSFSETIPDDNYLFYPDSEANATFWADAIAGESAGEGTTFADPDGDADYTDTWIDAGHYGLKTSVDAGDGWLNVTLTFRIGSSWFADYAYVKYRLWDAYLTPTFVDGGLQVYDWTNSEWDWLKQEVGFTGYVTDNYDLDGYEHSNRTVKLRVCLDVLVDANDEVHSEFWHVQIYSTEDSFASHYAESFADVSDWASYNGVENFGTDGDVGYIEMDSESANDYEGIEITGLSIPTEGYLELRFISNDTVADYIQIRLYDSGSKFYYVSPAEPTTWTTRKDYIKGMTNSGGAFDTIVKIQLLIRLDSGLSIKISYDYLRISPADESGWQHDGSTTAGITPTANMIVTTDGDELTLTPSADANYILFDVDITATATTIESDYYPFLETYISSVTDGDADGKVWLIQLIGTDANEYTTPSPYYADETGHHRFNIKASTIGDLEQVKFYVDDSLDRATFDYIKVYSIANYTVIEGGGSSVDDVLYVDAQNDLVSEGVGTAYHRLDADVTYSIDTSIYNVLNVTFHGLSNPSYPIGIYTNVEPVYKTEWRFPLVSGTLTYLVIRFQTSVVLSAIKFWEDATDPVLDNIFVNPPDPNNDESVSFTITCTDWTSLYSATINMAEYPSGFSDVDYAMTEQSITNIWMYTFSTMTPGYYLVGITVDDGQGTDTEYATLYVGQAATTVFELEIWQVQILDYHINVDWKTSYGNSTLKVYDNSSIVATGSNENFTLQFTKSTVVGLHDLDFLIDAGTAELWKNNTQYEIAQDQIVLSNSHYAEDGDSWAFSAEVNQNVNYYVYDNDSIQESGSKTTGFFSISRDFVNTVGKHIVKIKFNTSDDSEYAGGSYDVDTTLRFDSIDPDQDNETVSVGFRVVRSGASTLTYTVYEIVSGETLVASGSISVTSRSLPLMLKQMQRSYSRIV